MDNKLREQHVKEIIGYIEKKFFKASDNGEECYIDKKKKLLETFSIAIKFLTRPPSDQVFTDISYERQHTEWDFNQLEISRIFKDRREKLSGISVSAIGIHFIDYQIGRFSRIWTTPGWEEDVNSTHDIQAQHKTIYYWLYGHIWMKVYWHLLGSTTSLINALHENVIRWDGTPFITDWSSQYRDNHVWLGGFIETYKIRDLADEVAETIHRSISSYSGLDPLLDNHSSKGAILFESDEYRNVVEEIAANAFSELEESHLKCRIDEIFVILRKDITSNADHFDLFKRNLEIVSKDNLKEFPISSATSDADTNKSKYYWSSLLTITEALFSSIMNHNSFCSDDGFWIHKTHKDNEKHLSAVFVVAFNSNDKNNQREDVLRELETDIDTLFRIFESKYIKPIYKKFKEQITTFQRRQNNLLSKANHEAAYRIMEKLGDSDKEHGYERDEIEIPGIYCWAKTVVGLSEKSIHEGKETKYIFGFGPAYLGQVRCELFEKTPPSIDNIELSLDRRIDKTIHFVRSYYSLFGVENRICWFDPLGQLKGIYQRRIFDVDGEWLWGWDSSNPSYFVAKILGLRKIDFYDSKGQLIIQYRSGVVRDAAGQDDIKEKLSPLITDVFAGYGSTRHKEDTAKGIKNLLGELISKYQESAIGTSLVVLRTDKKDNWPSYYKDSMNARQSFMSQKKRLTTELDRFKHKIATTPDLAKMHNIKKGEGRQKIACIVENLSSLSKLDGATILEFNDSGLYCHPAMQIVPIIEWDEGGSYMPLDILSQDNPYPSNSNSPIIESKHIYPEKTCRLSNDNLRRLSKLLNGTTQPKDGEQKLVSDLMFLNSAGTRHHSLWGITVTSKEPLFTITLSEDGDLRFFMDGQALQVE